MNKLFCVLAFSAGTLVGYFIANKFLKEKYEKIAQEEIDSVKEVYSKNNEKKIYKETQSQIVNDINKVHDIISSSGYVNNEEKKTEPEKQQEHKKDENFVIIFPDEFGDTDYDTQTLVLCSDGILIDGITNDIIDDAPEIIGDEALNTFGEYDDSVYIRNNELKTDYEIVKDARCYSDIVEVRNGVQSDD